MTKVDIVSVIFDTKRDLSGISKELTLLARAFDLTGNQAMAVELRDIAITISSQMDQLVDAFGEYQREFFS